MPTYVYACRDCGARKEVFQRITDDPLTTCEECSGKVHRVLFPVGVVYKGSGFYVTDYARKGQNGSNGNGAKSEESASDAKTETKSEAKSETKSETKSESKTEAATTA